MANQPAILATVKITVKDINNNSVAKQYNAVSSLNFDYNKGMLQITNIGDGQFYFPLNTITTLTYTITSGLGGQHTVVMS